MYISLIVFMGIYSLSIVIKFVFVFPTIRLFVLPLSVTIVTSILYI